MLIVLGWTWAAASAGVSRVLLFLLLRRWLRCACCGLYVHCCCYANVCDSSSIAEHISSNYAHACLCCCRPQGPPYGSSPADP
jgi:hypothetical protein